MNDSSSEEQEQLAQWEAEQSDRILERTAQLATELIIADQKLRALRTFMAEVRSHEGEMLDWLIEQQQKGDYLGLSRDLQVMQDGTVGFWDF